MDLDSMHQKKRALLSHFLILPKEFSKSKVSKKKRTNKNEEIISILDVRDLQLRI